MPAQSGSQQQQQSENSLDFLWLIVIVLAAIVLAWYFGKNYISAFIYQIRLYEMSGIRFVLHYWQDLVKLVPFLPAVNMSGITHWETMIQTKQLSANLGDLQDISTFVGSYLRYPIILFLGIFAFIIYSKNVGMKFKNFFSMKRFKSLEVVNWPQITPVSKIDLVKKNIDEGPWAMSMTPMQFCKKYQLIDEIKKEDAPVTAELRKGAAYNLFVMQLGALWAKPEKMPIHVKALFGAFAACAMQDRDSATKLLTQISVSAQSRKLNFSGAEALFRKYFNEKLVLKTTYRHAYVMTVMASMLELARTDGVLGSAEFLWLKPLDRKLWYMLNSVGRQTAVPEVAGAFAHWLAERKLHRALRVPMVEEAVKGLEVALTEILYEPDEE